MTVRLEQVADEVLLKTVWKKEVRRALRSMTYNNFNLAHDPIHYAAYEWGLNTLVSTLSRDLRAGAYAPERGAIVRSAKDKGLSRPLCFLTTRDALVYRTITWLAKDQLAKGSEDWVGFQREDKGTPPDSHDFGFGDSFDWFRFWLARDGMVLRLIDDEVPYFVETDIANFYPSIRIEAIREHLHSQTDLEKEVVRLCCQIIDGVMPRRDYSETSLMGLPQEQIGSSRDIAHSLLLPVDEEFRSEGEQGLYTRFMDDILIGVDSPEAGERCISRLQRSLETLGLYPNASKTMVIPLAQYLEDAMVDENAEIERIEATIEASTSAALPHQANVGIPTLMEVIHLSRRHREMSPPLPRRWDRVSRRLYTLHRRIGYRGWWEYWEADIRAHPGSAAQVLEFVRAWQLASDTVESLVRISANCSHLYPNISLLAAETILTAPTPDDVAMWTDAFQACAGEVLRLLSIEDSAETERIAAAWLLAAWKFGDQKQREKLLRSVPGELDASSPARAQTLPLLVASGESITDWVAARPGLPWESALAAEYLRSLVDGDERATGVALSLMRPALRLTPQRFITLPRSVPLILVVARHSPHKLHAVAPKFLSDLGRNPKRLRDHRMEAILLECLGVAQDGRLGNRGI